MNTPVSFLRPQLDLRWARLDGCTVDVAANLLIFETEEVRLTPKAMAVLRELMARQGSVVKRDDLLGIVWRDGFPTDDVLTHAITELRRAMEEDPKNPQLIETVPRVGYRLRVPVEILNGPPEKPVAVAPLLDSAPSHLISNSTELPRTPWELWGILVILALVAIAVPMLQWVRNDAVRANNKAQAATQAMGYTDVRELIRPVTSDVGYESFPAISPDGAQVAFGAKSRDDGTVRIFVRALNNNGAALQLTRGKAVQDLQPVWSPDGTQIAFLRMMSAEACRVMVVPALGGFERDVTQCNAGTIDYIGWSPDSKKLITSRRLSSASDNKKPSGESAPRTADATNADVAPDATASASLLKHRPTQLVTIDLQSGVAEAFPYQASNIEHDVQPQYSPDGRWVAFRRGAVPYSDLYLVAGNGGEPRALTRIRSRIRGFDWMPDSKHILFSSDHQGQLALYLLAIETGAMRSLRVYDAHFPRVARNRPIAVYHVETGSQRMVEYNLPVLNGKQAESQIEKRALVPSNRYDSYPSYSPDGSKIAFVSDRGGDKQIWMIDPSQPTAISLTDHRGSEISEPQWSADGNRLAYILRNELGSAAFSVSTLNGQSRREIPEGENVRSAAFDFNGENIVYVSDRDGDWSLWVRAVGDVAAKRLASGGVQNVQAPLNDGHAYFSRLADRGLWRIKIDGSAAEELVSEDIMFWNGESWKVTDAEIYFLYERGQTEGIGLMHAPRGAIGGSPHKELIALSEYSTNQFALDAKGQKLIAIEAWEPGTDVMRIDLAPLVPNGN